MVSPRRTDSEFGGRGGVLPPVPSELSAQEDAMVQRMVSSTDPADNETAVRARLEKRGRRNDQVGKRKL